MTIENSRRQILAAAAGIVGTAAIGSQAGAQERQRAADPAPIPELAPQWKKLNLAEIVRRPAAFVSVSQNNSLYKPWGAQAAEKQWERGSLPATIKVVEAARKAANFKSFSWVGYSVFRENYPQSIFDKVQYETWVEGLNFDEAKKKADNELVDDLRALVQPGDLEFNELALQTAFVGTELPLELSRKKIEVIVLTGIHLDWCIEGNARAARDNGYLPIVIGDATATQRPEQQAAAYERINSFFAPVISADAFVRLLSQPA